MIVQSIITLKNVPEREKEIWVDLSPQDIRNCVFAAQDTGRQFLECKRFMGGKFYGYLVRIDDIVTVSEYR